MRDSGQGKGTSGMRNRLNNFSYVIAGVLAGMAKPGGINPLEADLGEIKAQGIRAIVTLTEEPLDRKIVAACGFEYLHLGVQDFMPPTLDQMKECIDFIDRMRALKKPVALHCYAGLGRTGTMLACYLVKEGLTAAAAIDEVRSHRPDSVQSDEQIAAVYRYESGRSAFKKS